MAPSLRSAPPRPSAAAVLWIGETADVKSRQPKDSRAAAEGEEEEEEELRTTREIARLTRSTNLSSLPVQPLLSTRIEAHGHSGLVDQYESGGSRTVDQCSGARPYRTWPKANPASRQTNDKWKGDRIDETGSEAISEGARGVHRTSPGTASPFSWDSEPRHGTDATD